MIIVLVILGLALGIVVSRGPMRSQALEVRAAAAQVAETLRAARGQAIARNQPVTVLVDLAQRSYRVDAGPPRQLPNGLAIGIVATTEQTAGRRFAGIRFEPDGSASGGRIEISGGSRRIAVGVDWLTGRVSVADAR